MNVFCRHEYTKYLVVFDLVPGDLYAYYYNGSAEIVDEFPTYLVIHVDNVARKSIVLNGNRLYENFDNFSQIKKICLFKHRTHVTICDQETCFIFLHEYIRILKVF